MNISLIFMNISFMNIIWWVHDDFKKEHPAAFKPIATVDALSLRQFEKLQPWNLKPAKQETCLCKSRENFGMYEEALSNAFKLLEAGLLGGVSDVDVVPEDEREAVLSCPAYQTLYQLTKLKRRIHKVESVLCPGAFKAGSMGCIDPGGCEHDTPCSKCGFDKIWSKGLRPLASSLPLR